MKLVYNEEKSFYTKTYLFNFKITIPLANLDMVRTRLVSNGLIYSGYILVDIQSVILFLLFSVSEPSKF